MNDREPEEGDSVQLNIADVAETEQVVWNAKVIESGCEVA